MEPNWQNLTDPIFHWAQVRPDAPALIEGWTTLGYGALASLVARTSIALRQQGIAPGARIGLALANSTDHAILLFALMRLGATPVEMPAEDSSETLAATARKYGIRTVFTEPHVTLPADIAQHRMLPDWRNTIAAASGDGRAALDADALQIITLPSGSAGIPAGIVTTHRQFMHRLTAAREIDQAHRLDEPPDATVLLTGSLRRDPFLRFLLGQIFVGGVTVLLPDFGKPIELVRAIASYDDAVAFVTATMCRLFIAAAPEGALLFPRVRLLVAGGSPLYADEKRAMLARVTPHFSQAYGTAGGGVIAALAPSEMPTKAETVGRPVAGVAVEIVDDRDRPVPTGSEGNIRCRGDLVALGRCAEDAAPGPCAEAFRDGWYYPGDAGALDADGFLHLRGRVGGVIKRGAIDVIASEVEGALSAHPGVAEAAVIGVPAVGRGEEVVAFVVKRGALDHEEFARHCRDTLAPSQRPDRIYYADALPRRAGGTVDRPRLQALALGEAMRRSR